MSPIIVIDVPITGPHRERLAVFGLRFLDGADIACSLAAHLRNVTIEPANRLLVFVEGGGEDVQRLIVPGLGKISQTRVWAKRHVPPPGELFNERRDPLWLTGEIETSPRFILPEIEEVILIDDIIGSGNTLNQIRYRNAWKFPRASWRAYALVGRVDADPQMPWVSPRLVEQKDDGGKVPLNSLSTLLADSVIAQDYARRNIAHPAEFLAVLSTIKKNTQKDIK